MSRKLAGSFLRSPQRLAALLLAWFDGVKTNRDMPWRRTRDPYAIWISEIMLQQTQVQTVKPFYRRFLARFPTIGALAAAHLDEVLALWSGLGYYRRARHLHTAARRLVAQFGGKLPANVQALGNLPGVGPYTAGAVASMAFGLPAAAVDGNVMRVLARLTACSADLARPAHGTFFRGLAQHVIDATPRQSDGTARYGDVNQALMELGATVCLPAPARPRCDSCAVRSLCRARAQGRQMELPVRSRRKVVPVIRGVAVVVRRRFQGRPQVLMMRRPAGGLWEHLWEFPVLAPPATGRKDMNWDQWLTDSLGLAARVTAAPHPRQRIIHQLSHRRMVCTLLSAYASRAALPRKLPACLAARQPYCQARWMDWPPGPGSRRGAPAVSALVRKIAAKSY